MSTMLYYVVSSTRIDSVSQTYKPPTQRTLTSSLICTRYITITSTILTSCLGTTRIRRLWLENCRISAGCNLSISRHPLHLPLNLDFSGLESIRFRRLPIRPGMSLSHTIPAHQFVNSRGGKLLDLQDGAGGQMFTTTSDLRSELRFSRGVYDLACGITAG